MKIKRGQNIFLFLKILMREILSHLIKRRIIKKMFVRKINCINIENDYEEVESVNSFGAIVTEYKKKENKNENDWIYNNPKRIIKI